MKIMLIKIYSNLKYIIIMILLSKMENLFAQSDRGPGSFTEQRQIDVALSLSIVERQKDSSNSYILT